MLLSALASCSKDKEAYTVVEGIVTDKYTKQPVAGVVLEVQQNTGCLVCMSSRRDSITSATTDASGNYKAAFNANQKGTYALVPASSDKYYLGGDEQVRFNLTKGQSNTVSIEATPYKTVTFRVNTTKQGKSAIQFYYNSDEKPGLGNFNGPIFDDTDPNRQNIVFTKTLKVLPDRVYRFTKTTYSQVCPSSSSSCQLTDQTFESRVRDIRFTNDTVTVSFN